MLNSNFFYCFLKVKLSNLIRFDIRCWHLDLFKETFSLISIWSIMAAIQGISINCSQNVVARYCAVGWSSLPKENYDINLANASDSTSKLDWFFNCCIHSPDISSTSYVSGFKGPPTPLDPPVQGSSAIECHQIMNIRRFWSFGKFQNLLKR